MLNRKATTSDRSGSGSGSHMRATNKERRRNPTTLEANSLRGLRMFSTLLDRMKIGGRLGLGFDGKRDYYKIFGWSREITFEKAFARYERQDVAKRVIDALAHDTWRNPPEFKDAGSQFDRKWRQVLRHPDVRIWNALERADKLAGLGRYSIILCGFARGSTNMTVPINGNGSELIYMQPYGQAAVRIKSFVTDAASPRFNLPEIYEIDPSRQKDIRGLSAGRSERDNHRIFVPFDVHASRVVHVIENPMEDNVYGTPRLYPIWNDLDDLYKICGGSAESYWRSAWAGLQADIDKDLQLDEDDAEALEDEVQEYYHEFRRFIRTRGVSMKSLQSTSGFPDPTGAFVVTMKLIAGSTGIPLRILLGSEAGQLASNTDRSNWADRISERQTGFAEPQALRPMVATLQGAGILPPMGRNAEIEWQSAYRQTPYEMGQTASQYGRAANAFGRTAKDGVRIVGRKEARVMMNLPPDLPEDDEWLEADEVETEGGAPAAEVDDLDEANREDDAARQREAEEDAQNTDE